MVYIYPKVISGTYHRSATYATQQLSNPQALCSGDQNLAYWGVKNPTWVGDYMRNWPDSLTSRSGSYYTPDSFKASGFSLDANKKTKIKKLSVEYKWEQISYSCGTSDCYGSFNKPVINLLYQGKVIGTTYGAVPEAIRYNNNKTNSARMNTDNAELANLHSHNFDISSYNLTAEDLKHVEVIFVPAPNQSYEYLRIVMQFLRLNIDKEDYVPAPLCQINTSLSKDILITNEKFEYTLNLKTVNKEFSTTRCSIDIPHGLTIANVQLSNNTSYDKGIWEVRQVDSTKKASIKLTLMGTEIGEKTIEAKILNNADSINNKKQDDVTIIDKNITFDFQVDKTVLHKKYHSQLNCFITLRRNNEPKTKETIIFDSNNLITQNSQWIALPDGSEHKGKGVWEIPNTYNKTSMDLQATVEDADVGDYTLVATHKEVGEKNIIRTQNVSVLTEPLSKEYFKLRIEDGSDIQYNSLMFTEGDDLLNPLTYDLEDADNRFIDALMVEGETKKIPTGEARYISFKINLDLEEGTTYKNVLTSINTNGHNDIIVGADDNINIFESSSGHQYFSIDEIVAGKEKKIRFIVQSEEERDVYIHLNILNKTNDKWIPARAIFKDMPSIKLRIENLTATEDFFITEENQGKFTLRYSIQNESQIEGNDLKFKIIPPSDFNISTVVTQPQNSIYDENSNMWYFNKINKDDNKKYYIDIEYTATRSNIYDFIIQTVDDPTTYEDDQHPNSFKYKMYIDIDMMVSIDTNVSNAHPYVNNIIDFTILLKNYRKKQKDFKFQVMDIGKYNFLHNKCDYNIEFVDCEQGTFTKDTRDNNVLGFWEIDQIDVDKEYKLMLSLRPFNPGTHVIHTTFTNDKQQSLDFDDYVQVYSEKNKLDFDVHHAVCDKVCNDPDCDNKTICDKCQPCDELVEICDEDFITLGDKYYYRFKVTNNDKNDISNLHIFCQIDDSFDIDCTCPQIANIHFDGRKENNLYEINIDKIKACSSLELCFRVKPTKNGIYYSNFILTTKDAHILSKTLKMTVSNVYTERKVEHIITVYNFEKTHRYFRYELDGSGNLFKFFNTGDISKRLIDIEDHNVNSVEVFKGTNLYELCRKIKQKSIYVDPELLRIGTNKLLDNGYELYPDGFIRRFGLLNSEVFHFTGQLPIITNLSQYAMRWDIDNWNEKVWAGDVYGNGVFDLTIDYDKIPTNFDIMQDTMNPVYNLENIVEKTKPYGTKGLCHYNYNSYIDLTIDADLDDVSSDTYNELELNLDDLGLVSWYDRDDNSIAIFYDLFTIKQDIDASLDGKKSEIKYKDNRTNIQFGKFSGYVDYFKPNLELLYIEDCYETIKNKYNKHSDRTRRNIDIIKANINNENSIHTIDNNIIPINILKEYGIVTLSFDESGEDQQLVTINDDIKIYKINNKVTNQNGFIISNYDEMYVFFDKDIYNYAIQLEYADDILHVWVSINGENFYHFGYIDEKINKIEVHSPKKINVSYRETGNNRQDRLTLKIKNTIDQIIEEPNNIYTLGKKNNWSLTKNIYDFFYFENNIKIDKECALQYVQIPPLALKFNNINIDNFDEVVDIDLQVKAQSNKKDFINDLQINFFKNADYYIPNEGESSYINYPSKIRNINKRYTPTITITQPNITICSNCLRTNLGYYDECPDCGSELVVHYKEKQKATACYTCGWIADGWNDKCNFCLSQDIEKIMIDYNKTYCNNCGHLSDKFYNDCPRCFSNNVVHLQNDAHTFQIYDNEVQNIDPITIQTSDRRVNVCNFYVPLTGSIIRNDGIEKLNLKIEGTNNLDGKYYYCPSCESGGLGNHKKCPKCGSKKVYNYEDLNLLLTAYVQYGDTFEKVSFKEGDKLTYEDNTFIKTIDLRKIALKNTSTDFTIYLYIENINYETQKENISKLNIKDSIIDKILSKVNKIDISIDNISSESKYINEKEWTALNPNQDLDEAIYGLNHTAIIRNEKQNTTEFIEFSDFNLKEYSNLKHAFLYFSGVNKTNAHAKVIINVINNGYLTSYQSYVDNGIFTFEHDLFEIIKKETIKDIKIQISFVTNYNKNDINITDLNIKTVKERTNKIHPDIIEKWTVDENDDDNYKSEIKNNTGYRLSSEEDDVWKLNNTLPGYLSGKTLETGLICYLNFGTLSNEEYIRLYEVNIIVSYKNKVGTLITKNIPLHKNSEDIQNIEGKVIKEYGDIMGTARQRDIVLNNLEFNSFTDTGDEQTLNALPLNQTLAQSFKLSSIIKNLNEEFTSEEEKLSINNIAGFSLEYFGKVGYPGDFLHISLYDDDNGKPGNFLGETWHNVSKAMKNTTIWIPLDHFNIAANKNYWFIIKDLYADENNYHRIRYNKNSNVGKLLIEKNGILTEENNYALSFAISTSYSISSYNNLPADWNINVDDDKTNLQQVTNNFDVYNVLYRYNIQKSNVTIKNLEFKSGYRQYFGD